VVWRSQVVWNRRRTSGVIPGMARTHRNLVVVAATLALAGCGPGGASTEHGPDTASTSHATSTGPHVVATLDVSSPNQAVVTQDRLWLLGGPSGVITQVDPATNEVTRVVRLPHPVGFGTYAPPFVWVASYLYDVVMQLDAETGQVLRTFKRSRSAPWDGPVGLVSTGTDLYVVNHNSPTLVRLDLSTGEVNETTRLPGRKAAGPVLAGGMLWIAMTKGNLVVRVDPTTGQIDGPPIHLDSGACAATSEAGGALWYTSLEDGSVGCHDGTRRVDPLTGEVSPIDYGAGMSMFADVGSEVWGSDRQDTLYRVDVATGKLTPTLSLDGGADSNRLTNAFGSLWVLRSEANQVIRIDTSS
jgi:streptogramin lyase